MSNHTPKPIADLETFLPIADELIELDVVKLSDIDSINDPRSKWDRATKLKAVVAYSICGNMSEVSRQTGVPVDTIKYWRDESPWWKEAIVRIKAQRNERMDIRLTRAMDQVLDQILDRIQNGDEVILRDGTKVKQGIKAKELSIILAVLYDKRALLRGDPTSNPGRRESTTNEVLGELKSSFEKLSSDIKRRDNEKVVSEQ